MNLEELRENLKRLDNNWPELEKAVSSESEKAAALTAFNTLKLNFISDFILDQEISVDIRASFEMYISISNKSMQELLEALPD